MDTEVTTDEKVDSSVNLLTEDEQSFAKNRLPFLLEMMDPLPMSFRDTWEEAWDGRALLYGATVSGVHQRHVLAALVEIVEELFRENRTGVGAMLDVLVAHQERAGSAKCLHTLADCYLELAQAAEDRALSYRQPNQAVPMVAVRFGAAQSMWVTYRLLRVLILTVQKADPTAVGTAVMYLLWTMTQNISIHGITGINQQRRMADIARHHIPWRFVEHAMQRRTVGQRLWG